MRTSLHTIDQLKVDGMYFAAGVLAYALDCDATYGCHFGMKSTRDAAIEEYRKGWHAARDARASKGSN